MSAAIKVLPQYTFEDYQQWEGKWELIEGIPYSMSPAPLPKYQYIGNNIAYEFTKAVKSCRNKPKCKVYQPLDYKIGDRTVFQPDVLIVCKEIKKAYLNFAPALVVEILSPSTELIDRHTKYYAYGQQGIPYYLIIVPEEEMAEVYELENNEYKLRKKEHHFTYTFQLEDYEATIDFNEIWS